MKIELTPTELTLLKKVFQSRADECLWVMNYLKECSMDTGEISAEYRRTCELFDVIVKSGK